VKRALAALRKVTPNVIGAVLNAVDVKTKGYYGYAYYGSRKERREKAEARRSAAAGRPRLAGEARGEVGDASIV
jgi:Mrp family chromosome partitioning ATPase